MKRLVFIVFLISFSLVAVAGCRKISIESVSEIFSQKLGQLRIIADQYSTTINDSLEDEECVVYFDDYDISVLMNIVDGSPDYSITYRGNHCDFDNEFYSLFLDITKCFYDIDEEKIKEHIKIAVENSESNKSYNYEKPLKLFSSLTLFFNKFSYSDYEISINKI